MANVLVIKAHPQDAENSKSVFIMGEFLKKYQQQQPEDKITCVDLYQEFIPEIDREILEAWGKLQEGSEFLELSRSQQKKVARFQELTQQFLAADKIILVNALWNLNIPTLLKAWIDTICVAGTTFKYTAEGPVGLVTGKKMLHIQASGGIYQGEDFAAKYIQTIFHFIGISDTHQILIEGIDYNPSTKEEVMNAVLAQADQMAKKF